MPKAPLYTVSNPAKEPRFAEIGIRKEPIDAGLSKELAISAETAADLAGQGFKVTGPDGKAVSGRKAKAD
ncbi:hypothetical protein ASE63_22385 [Bosea sp. Root381]|uniref:hypothetical protein n=1 Tax=Bosea sp. Root381 TaxID=1736524 RepID=UPI0006FC4685|nr:hypothetical protein [Bosea sp. Root381]KRE07450.1 hypothetical protein ASE63_22385 [Bosea sp. Root381]